MKKTQKRFTERYLNKKGNEKLNEDTDKPIEG